VSALWGILHNGTVERVIYHEAKASAIFTSRPHPCAILCHGGMSESGT